MSRLLVTLALSLPIAAQGAGMPPSSTIEAREEAASQLDKVGVMVDRELTFTDERGYPFQLKQMFPGDTPVVLMLGYYHCPAMCGQVLAAAFQALSEVSFEPGLDYRILSVSVDPKETATMARERKETFLPRLHKTGGDDAWRLLVGDEANIQRLTEAVGFRYYWSEATKQFAHPPSLIFLTKEGKVSRIVVNTAFEADDMQLALVEASEGRLGTFLDRVRLNCLTFDSRTNSYSLAAMTIMRIGGAITVAVLGLMIWFMLRRERRQPTTAIA